MNATSWPLKVDDIAPKDCMNDDSPAEEDAMPCPDCNPMVKDHQVELERRNDRRQFHRPQDQ